MNSEHIKTIENETGHVSVYIDHEHCRFYIYNLWVLPVLRGNGHGYKLMMQAMKYILEQNEKFKYNYVYLYANAVPSSNFDLKIFYSLFGFKRLSNDDDFCCMTYDL